MEEVSENRGYQCRKNKDPERGRKRSKSSNFIFELKCRKNKDPERGRLNDYFYNRFIRDNGGGLIHGDQSIHSRRCLLSYLYVCEQGAVVGISEERFQVKLKDEIIRSIPAMTLEVIELFGNVQLTTQCMTRCLRDGINVVFYSTNGSYYGRLISTNHVNVSRQRKQAELNHDDVFKMEFSKRIITAKIHNQTTLLRRYARHRDMDITEEVKDLQRMAARADHAVTIEELMGYEGFAAKIYFKTLGGKLIDKEFVFHSRTRRPPTDPFNSLISLGYSIILNEMYGKIEAKGLNPYFGFMHKDRENHPTLASDLMEEWRAVLIDSTALSVLNGHELLKDDFYIDDSTGGVLLKRDAFKKYVAKLETKFQSEMKYLSYVDYAVSFRGAIDLQINRLVHAVEKSDTAEYIPIMIR